MHRYELTVTLAIKEETLEYATLAHLDDGRRSAALQQWSSTSSPGEDSSTRRDRIITVALEHGWTLPSGRWPRFSKEGLTLAAIPQTWETILSESTQTRQATLAHLADLEAGWRAVIADADLPVIQIGKLVGFTRHRVYQLRQQ